VEVSEKEIHCLLYFSVLRRKFSDIFKFVNDKKILQMASLQGYATPSCILYVDDIFVFCRTDNKSLINLSVFLKIYGDFSGQYVNNYKSSFFTMDNFSRFFTKNVFFLVVMVVYLLLI